MCLLVIAHGISAEYPLVLAGNRDEFHGRPSQEARWWPDKRDVLGGRDDQAGGTWLAVHRDGRFATVTNFRDAVPPSSRLRSRGHLITEYLDGVLSPEAYLASIDGERYAGFNLLVGDKDQLVYLSNRGAGLVVLPPGLYGVANATLDTPWSKVERSKTALAELLESGRANETNILKMLRDRDKASVHKIDADGLPFARAHAFSAPFIVQPDYGTRCSTVLLRDVHDRVRFTEVRYGVDGESRGRSDFAFEAKR